MAILPFVEQLLPENVSYGAKGGPGFKTEIFTSASGFEQRSVLWAISRAEYDISFGIRDEDDMKEVITFFYNMRGRATGFRFKDWSDYQLKDENIGTADGVQTVFPITKTYTLGAGSYVRDIFKIKTGAISNVRVNDVLVAPVDYVVNHDQGTITFNATPATGAVVIDCEEFHVPVRFDTDQIPVTLEAFEVQSTDGIKLVELKLERA
jgi:uncharacterized protein (TIGR02217 family)